MTTLELYKSILDKHGALNVTGEENSSTVKLLLDNNEAKLITQRCPSVEGDLSILIEV